MPPQREPLDVFATPIYSPAWREVMKWPASQIAVRPIDRDNFEDEDVPKPVCLIVKLPTPPNPFLPPLPPSDPTHLHWSIRWPITIHNGYQYERIVHIERAALVLGHLTNWGPLTKIHHIASESGTFRVFIGQMTLQQRQNLERIALTQPIQDPDGRWNCQHWTKDILTRATVTEYDAQGNFVHGPLITVQRKDYVLWAAHYLRLE